MGAYKNQMSGRTCLYRACDAAGHLLYVGITRNPAGRFAKHSCRQPWWPEVAGLSLEWFDTRDAARAAEARAIRDESPAYNVSRPKVWC